MADRNGAVVAGVLLGALIAGAANRNRQNHRFDFSTDQAFYPSGMPGVTCYVRAQQCYEDGNYSRWATRQVFR